MASTRRPEQPADSKPAFPAALRTSGSGAIYTASGAATLGQETTRGCGTCRRCMPARSARRRLIPLYKVIIKRISVFSILRHRLDVSPGQAPQQKPLQLSCNIIISHITSDARMMHEISDN
ncbi:uncharacterized protein TrAFT101_009767 [Trichoderma asperellum]|uniref:uncharacterized protein n=1 Tax=Trichoderma asperellum TaxID=101201 RepID=UPI0033344DCE|nr:hypothetical protein TrAFT101_009767 [Trichoderma asperellum]